MKLYLSLVTLVVLATVGAGLFAKAADSPPATTPSEKWIEHRDDVHHFSISYPPDWTCKPGQKTVITLAYHPDGATKPGLGMSVTAHPHTQGATLDATVKKLSDETLPTRFKHVRVLSSSHITIAGVDGRELTVTYQNEKDVTLHVDYRMFAANGWFYMVDAATRPENTDRFARDVERVEATFKLLP